jgi:integrase/recombinase XerD
MARRKNKIPVIEVPANQSIDSFEYYYHLFMRDCMIRNLSEHTIQYYKNELLKFCKRLERDAVSTIPECIIEEHIKEHVILSMMREGLKETTINANLRAIRSFFNFLDRECFIVQNPMKKINLIRQKKTVIQTFSRDEIHSCY